MLNIHNINIDSYNFKECKFESLKFLDNGSTCDVYQLSDDKILKLYYSIFDAKYVSVEYYYTKYAYDLGIPTPKALDLVSFNNRYGIVFERIKGKTLASCLVEDAENYDDNIKKYCEFINDLNNIQCENKLVCSAKENKLHKFQEVSNFFTDNEIQAIFKKLDSIDESNNLLHGDPNINNILVKDNQMYFIDIGTLMKGNQIYDISALCSCYVYIDKINHNNDEFYGTPKGFIKKIMSSIMKYYKFDEDVFNILACINLLHLYDKFYDILKCYLNMEKEKVMEILRGYLIRYL